MNRTQKMAWFLVIAIGTGLVLSALAIGVLYWIVGMPRAWAGIGCMGIAGIGGLAPLFFRRDKGKVTFDERDLLIKRRAALAGFVPCAVSGIIILDRCVPCFL